MKYLELVDQAHQHLAMMGGMSMEDRRRIIGIMQRMIDMDWETAQAIAKPALAIVASG